MNKKKYKILIPAYNAERYLDKLFEKIDRVDSLDNVIVIDDGSIDKTSQICKDKNVEVLSSKINQGKGKALKIGFEEVLKRNQLKNDNEDNIHNNIEFVITLDADLQHDVDSLPLFIEKCLSSNSDIIIGSRMEDTSNMPKDRILSNKLTSYVVSFVAGQNIADSQSGYRLIKTAVLNEIDLISDKYEMESELLIKASRNGFKIDSVPIPTIYNDEHSSINRFKDTYRFIKMIFRLMVVRG